jgi:hypothetical protein
MRADRPLDLVERPIGERRVVDLQQEVLRRRRVELVLASQLVREVRQPCPDRETDAVERLRGAQLPASTVAYTGPEE